MSRRGGDSYFVLVNNKDEVYEQKDNLGFTYTVDFNIEEEAKEMLEEFIETEELDPTEGWHVERYRW